MPTRRSRIYVAMTLVSVGIVAGAAIAQAIREHSWEPIWSVAWLPAVLLVTLKPSGNRRGCWPRLRKRARS